MVMIFTAFPTAQDATNYLNAINKTGLQLRLAQNAANQRTVEHQAPIRMLPVTHRRFAKYYKRSEGTSTSFRL